VHLRRLVREGALDEARNDHPVLAALARADSVEEPDDDAVQPHLLVIGERQELVHRLGVGVGPAAHGRRSVDPPGILRERHLLAVVAVDLARRGDQHALVEAVAVLEHELGAAHVRDERVHGLLDDEPDSDGGCHVEDDVALVHELVDDGGLEDGVHHRWKSHRSWRCATFAPVEVERSSSAKTSQPEASR
jgi:hypothetical protein